MGVTSKACLMLGLGWFGMGLVHAEIPVQTGLPELSKQRAQRQQVAIDQQTKADQQAHADKAAAKTAADAPPTPKAPQPAPHKAEATPKPKATPTAPDKAEATPKPKATPTDPDKAEATPKPKAAPTAPDKVAAAPKPKAVPTTPDKAEAAPKPKTAPTTPDKAEATPTPKTAPTAPDKAEATPKPKTAPVASDKADTAPKPKASPKHTDLASQLKAKGIKSRWIKLSAQGTILPDHAQTWACVYDQQRRLIWEEKSDHGLHAAQDRYVLDQQALKQAAVRCHGSVGSCTVTRYLAALSQRKHCGVRGWQLPSLNELESLKSGSAKPAEGAMIYTATRYFEYWPQRAIYWSANRVEVGGLVTSVYYTVDFNKNTSPIFDAKDSALAVRAVAREPQEKR